MPNISGRLVFDVNRSNSIDALDTGLANIPIVLRNTTSGLRVTALTDINGNYSFSNVPNGNYIIVEAFGESGGGISPVDFGLATVGPIPTGNDPPIAYATNPPTGANNIDSLTPNTLNVTVSGADLINENFLDGPVIYTPISNILDSCSTIIPGNLITVADNGTFGSYPAGTAANTSPPVNPYPGVTPGFIYATGLTPADGTYVIKNIMTDGGLFTGNVWWRTTDKTVGDETGRFMAVGGSNPGGILFTQTVNVSQNTNYIFTSWILNLIRLAGYADPALGVQILDQGGGILYNQTLGNQIPYNPNAPEWKEIGTVINSGSNNQLTIRFVSQGPSAAGNDFALDDVEFRQIDVPLFTPVKSVSKSYADIGDTVTYTVTLHNTCNNRLSNVTFIDNIPNDLSFVSGTVKINGVTNAGLNPETGFSVANIAGGATTTITFDAIVNSIPTPTNVANNFATMGYSYSPVTGGIEIPYSSNSNIVPVTINHANLVVSKVVDKGFADVGDTITYTITALNTGNVFANFVKITDIIPNNTTLVPGTVTSNVQFTVNVPNLTVDLLNPIAPNQTVTVTFKVTVDSIPVPNPIPNNASVSYKYTTDPNILNGNQGTATTNTVNTTVNNANIVISKSVDKEAVLKGGVLNYSISVTNNGNVSSNPVIVTDLIPVDTTYASNTLRVDGVLNSSNPSLGVNVGPLGAGATKTITFSVLVSQGISNIPIDNIATVDYTYIVNPSNPGVTGTNESNMVTVNVAAMTIVKSVDKSYAEVADTITYKTVLTNTGNVTLTNVTFRDTPPANTTFIPGSVYINNVNQPALSPLSNINIGTVLQGQIVEVEYKATIDSLPSPPELRNISEGSFSYLENSPADVVTVDIVSNEVVTQVIQLGFNTTKAVDKTYALVGDTIVYTITGTNTGNVNLNNVVLTDIVPSETSFVLGSVVVNGVSRPSDNPLSGIAIGNVNIGQTVTITFSVKINTLPADGNIVNNAKFNFSYIVDPNSAAVTSSKNTNDVVTYVSILGINIIKTVDKTSANLGDVLTYNFIIINNGTIDVYNSFFRDTIPNGSTFEVGTVTVDGVSYPSYNPSTGFNVGNISANQTVRISFKVKVTAIVCEFELVNVATLNFNYNLGNTTNLSGSATSNSVITTLNIGSFKQLYVDETLKIQDTSKDIYSIVNITVNIVIDASKIVTTSIGTSIEGQTLTGKKLRISGRLVQNMEYKTNPPDQTSYFENFEVPFCTFIVIEDGFNETCCYNVLSEIEDVYYTKIDSRTIFKNVTFRVFINKC